VAFRFSRSATKLDNLPALVAGLGVAMPAFRKSVAGAERGISREFIV
jgi:hypothetical protein